LDDRAIPEKSSGCEAHLERPSQPSSCEDLGRMKSVVDIKSIAAGSRLLVDSNIFIYHFAGLSADDQECGDGGQA
jgi:hypothetical protein